LRYRPSPPFFQGEKMVPIPDNSTVHWGATENSAAMLTLPIPKARAFDLRAQTCALETVTAAKSDKAKTTNFFILNDLFN
jgi:hypothetical protein